MDFTIITTILDYQNTISTDAIVEIGVHHGKGFVPLALHSGARKLCAIDIFDDQDANIDLSGHGDRAVFERNLADFGVDPGRLSILSRRSTEVRPAELRDLVGAVSFFHIDGGHDFETVKSDVALAVAVATEHSVIVLDDMFRPEWPEVSMAAFSSDSLAEHDFVLCAIGFNKSYFCKAPMVEAFHSTLAAHPDLPKHISKRYMARNLPVLVFQRYPLPEWPLRKYAYWYLSVKHPVLFNRLHKYLDRFRYLGRTRPDHPLL